MTISERILIDIVTYADDRVRSLTITRLAEALNGEFETVRALNTKIETLVEGRRDLAVEIDILKRREAQLQARIGELQANLPAPDPDFTATKIAMIKVLRRRYNLGLREAKDLVEKFLSEADKKYLPTPL